ncbi:helix-turn-helix transcriptional regulator [Lactobacillus mulieris]|nr:helix-turn-helix transcriptional regulator [Lactobacillus mulieris]MDT9628680.1 helix-turn-helix transcriptional regulator [Lactobacillus mulieris]
MDMCLGAVIRDRRKAMKLTQEDLAEFSGLSVNFISRIERTGDQNISIKKIDAIAQSLNMDTPSLIAAAYGKVDISSYKLKGDDIFIQKIVTELRKLSTFRAEKVCKAILSLVKEIMSQHEQNKEGSFKNSLLFCLLINFSLFCH